MASPSDVLAVLDRIRAEIDALRLIIAGEESLPIAPTKPAAGFGDYEPEWVNLATAAAHREQQQVATKLESPTKENA